MTEEKLRQLFKNHSDCYAVVRPEDDGSDWDNEKIVPAMTEDGFVWALRTAGLITI